MHLLRRISIALAVSIACCALAQPSTVDELAHALNTDAFVTDEPLGLTIDCAPYQDLFPEMTLACFALYMPQMVITGRFETYVSEQEAFGWAEEAWLDVADLPVDVDPDDDHVRRTIVAASGRTYVLTVFDAGPSSHIVVASEGE